VTPHALSQLLLIVVIVALIVYGRRNHDQWQQLNRELLQRMPVFSAETTKGREAEFIRDRLPKRTSWVLYALAATLMVVVVVLQWWFG
jgi:hypothetical protein